MGRGIARSVRPGRATGRLVGGNLALVQQTIGTLAELARQANEHYERARAAQRSDDWATYGAEMRRLGDVLRQLGRARDGATAPARP
jgi:hypothetical protein